MNRYTVVVAYRNTGDQGVLYKSAVVSVEAVDEWEARLKAIDAAFAQHPEGEHFTPRAATLITEEPDFIEPEYVYRVTYYEGLTSVESTEIDEEDEAFAWFLFEDMGHVRTDWHTLRMEKINNPDYVSENNHVES